MPREIIQMELIFSAKTRALLASAGVLLALSTPCLGNSIPPTSPPVAPPSLHVSTNLFRFGPASFGPGDLLPNVTGALPGFAEEPMALGSQFFTPGNLSAVALEEASLPRRMETSGDFTALLGRFVILLAGVSAIVLFAFRSGRSMAPAKTPPAPVRTLTSGRAWAQPGTTFLPPRTVVEEVDYRPRPTPFPETEPSPAR